LPPLQILVGQATAAGHAQPLDHREPTPLGARRPLQRGRQSGENGSCSREPCYPAQARTQHPSIPSRHHVHTTKNQARWLGQQLPPRLVRTYAIALPQAGRGDPRSSAGSYANQTRYHFIGHLSWKLSWLSLTMVATVFSASAPAASLTTSCR